MSEPPKAQLPLSDPRPSDVAWPPLRWPVPPDTVLLGRVVELRPTVPDRDAAELFTALDSDDVWRHVRGRPSTVAELAASLQARIATGQQPFTIRLRQPYRGIAAGTVAGTSSYLDVAPSDGRLEIGFTTYTRPLWGSVLNPDAKLALLRYAFDELGAGRVQLKTDIRNSRSQLAIARLGAVYEGQLRRYQRRADDTIRDTVVFSIIAEEWPTVRDGLQARVDVADLT